MRGKFVLFAIGIAAVFLTLIGVQRKDAEPDRLKESPFLYAQFCSPVPEDAKVSASVRATRLIDLTVPAEPADPSQFTDVSAKDVLKGDVVEFRIASPVSGALAVHGLSDLIVMKAGQTSSLRFRAIYSGRFPLHFHGADGSHYEIYALNVKESL